MDSDVVSMVGSGWETISLARTGKLLDDIDGSDKVVAKKDLAASSTFFASAASWCNSSSSIFFLLLIWWCWTVCHDE